MFKPTLAMYFCSAWIIWYRRNTTSTADLHISCYTTDPKQYFCFHHHEVVLIVSGSRSEHRIIEGNRTNDINCQYIFNAKNSSPHMLPFIEPIEFPGFIKAEIIICSTSQLHGAETIEKIRNCSFTTPFERNVCLYIPKQLRQGMFHFIQHLPYANGRVTSELLWRKFIWPHIMENSKQWTALESCAIFNRSLKGWRSWCVRASSSDPLAGVTPTSR